MADYIVSSSDLTDIADAIRTKGGTSAPLTFPAGFVSAVENIPTGGGGGGDLVVYVSITGYASSVVQVNGVWQNNYIATDGPLIVEGATITLETMSDWILDTLTGRDSGNAIPFTTVNRYKYTFTMPGESVFASLLYDD